MTMQKRFSPILTLFSLNLCICSLLSKFHDEKEAVLVAGSQEQYGLDLITFNSWEVIGPFRIGTREAVWGSDPVKAFDGEIRDSYPSPLAVNATVQWEPREFINSFSGRTASVDISLIYEAIDWAFLRSIYGWAALQYQAWARSDITYHGEEPINILIYPTGILEIVWNGHAIFGGDFFGFERPPVVVQLNPGRNTIRVRLVRDVRASGGDLPPQIDAQLHFDLTWREGVAILPESMILPDTINGKPASLPASAIIVNLGGKSIKISGVFAENGKELHLLSSENVIVPGQSRPIAFSLGGIDVLTTPSAVSVHYTELHSTRIYNLKATATFSDRDPFSPHKITFLHPGGSVSYAILKPPPQTLSRDHHYDLPVMVNLHGAGLDVDSPQVRHSFDAAEDLPCWMLFPQGMSLWSGDDWHTWGIQDVVVGLEAVDQWSINNDWRGPGILRDIIVTGHSNGGQGAWQLTMRHPDHIIAAAIASGYSSIQNYVPYTLWTEADPRQNAVLETALSSFKHELFVENLQRTPVLVQHGSVDNNVPVYHARLMTALARQNSVNFTFAELEGKGHWFDEAMTTIPLLNFYREFCRPGAKTRPTPAEFHFVVPLSDDMSTKYGMMIDQLQTPDRLGKVAVTSETRKDETLLWRIKTTNIHRWHFERFQATPDAIQLDNWPQVVELNDSFLIGSSFFFLGNGLWSMEADFRPTLSQRTGSQRGAMEAILRTRGPFQIVYLSGSIESYRIAVQVSRNLVQYFGADAIVRSSDDYKLAYAAEGNIINIVLGAQSPPSQLKGFPIHADQAGIRLRGSGGITLISSREARGAAWLQPLPDERLELVIWGLDVEGLNQASRMVPTLTGAGQPDFVVFGKEATWKGHGGTLAMGFFDYSWNISVGSFLT